MAKDYTRIRDNIRRMIDQKAPEAEIDFYLKTEGFTPEQWRKYGSEVKTRGDVLPLARTNAGDLEFAWPQFLKDMGESATLPGRVYKGEPYSLSDATKFALDWAVPFEGSASMYGRSQKMSKRDVIKAAPDADDLAKQASQKFTAARASGTKLNAEQYLDFVADLDSMLRREGIDTMLHPKASAVMNAVEKRLGSDVGIDDLMTIRRQMGIAARSVAPELADERRLAQMMIDKLDDLVDNASLKEGQALWARKKKFEVVNDMVENAKLQASGFENGLRIQARQLLKDKKRIRGFTPDERAALKEIDKGATGTKLLRILGKLSYGKSGSSNFLGGSIGVAGGAAIGGPAGAVMAPAIGAGAQRLAERSTSQAAQYARALAGLGGHAPRVPATAPNIPAGMVWPAIGTQVPQSDALPDSLLQYLMGSRPSA